MSNVLHVTDATFEAEVEKHDGLAIVDFWATWCGPCRMIAPILDQLATEYEGKVKVTKLDIDANVRTSARFNVRSIPTLLFFKEGKVVDQIIGAVPSRIHRGEAAPTLGGVRPRPRSANVVARCASVSAQPRSSRANAARLRPPSQSAHRRQARSRRRASRVTSPSRCSTSWSSSTC